MNRKPPPEISQEDIDKYKPLLDLWFARMLEDPLTMLDVLNMANNIRRLRAMRATQTQEEPLQTLS